MNRSVTAITIAFFVSNIVAGCQNQPSDMPTTEMPPAPEPGVVDITAIGLTFEVPDSIPSGWTTFRFENTADVTHFAVIERLPEGVGVEEQQESAAPIFQEAMDLIAKGQPDSAFAAFGKLPEWFGQIVFVGGPGLTAPRLTSQTTVHLDPGHYLLECYAKTDGIFHSYNPNPGKHGMVKEFVVTDESNGVPPPTPDIEITLSSEGGLVADSVTSPGEYTVAVHFADQIVHENFVGHDVHLARINEGTDLEALGAWIDWLQPTGFDQPAPVEFLGGAQEMPAGSTEYFTVTLEPGRYAWISEVTNPAAKGMLKTFEIGTPNE